MNFKICVALAGFAVLMAAANADNDTQTNISTPATTDPVLAIQVSSETAKPAAGVSPVVTLTTSQKLPITCKVGNCTGAGCYNKTSFNKTTECKSGESCYLLKVSATNYTMSCQTSTQCKSLAAKGTAACCETNNCIPDLAKAKATAKNNGCVSHEINIGFVLAIMAILLPKII